MTRTLAISVGVSLGLLAPIALAQDTAWRPAPAPPSVARSVDDLSSAVTLGRPVPLSPAPVHAQIVDGAVAPASYEPTLGAPTPASVRGQSPDAQPMPPGSPGPGGSYPTGSPTGYSAGFGPRVQISGPPGDPYNGSVVPYNGGVVVENPSPFPPPSGGGWFDGAVGALAPTGGRCWFQSDHAFDSFISPLSNPFRFEDPRSLTEVRPIYIHQGTPDKNWVYRGGDVEFFGSQFRLALTERWSVVINEFGGIWSEPHNHVAGFEPHAGFAEFQIGPKFTFLRCEDTCTVAAAGLIFDIPAGSARVFQDTGTLSLVPYVSVAQRFGRTSYGSFDFLGTLGYSFSVDNKRTDYLYTSLHLDFDICETHKWYPLIELNWYHYTSGGKSRNLDFEGRDLFNFGSRNVSGNDDLSMALGFRYKFSEWAQTGLAAEFPLTGRRDLMDYRITADFIFRY